MSFADTPESVPVLGRIGPTSALYSSNVIGFPVRAGGSLGALVAMVLDERFVSGAVFDQEVGDATCDRQVAMRLHLGVK